MATEPVPPSLSPYQPGDNEKQAYQHLFDKADTDGLGVLTGDKAVPFFQHSQLSPSVLGTVWGICDPANTGFLSPHRFGAACRLIGHAQQQPSSNTQVKDEWLAQAGPFPKFQGFPIPSHLGTGASTSPAPAAATSAPSPLQMQGTGGGAAAQNVSAANSPAGNTVTPDEKARYSALFAKSGPNNGLLDGDKARDIFIKSKLPFETLGQIWNLADTQSRGSLDVVDFTIGMHLIQHTMNGSLPALPAVLNPSLYASAASLPLPQQQPGSPITNVQQQSRLGAGPGSPLRQGSLPVQQQQQPQFGGYSSPQQQQSSAPWDISAQDKRESDGYFDGIDTTRKGTIEGEAAVAFFMQSGLGMDVLARVWDLADIRQTGALNKDEFAVALRLIRDRVAGKEIPQALPLSLVPPSLRQGQQQQAVSSGVQRDLLDLMDNDDGPAPATTVQPIVPQGTGMSSQQQQPHFQQQQQQQQQRSLSPQVTGTGTSTPQYGLAGTIFPQATGQSLQTTLSPQTTGAAGFSNNFAPQQQPRSSSINVPAQAAVPAAASASAAANFFDDNDDADQQAQLASDSARLSGLKEEHSTIEGRTATLKTQRGDIEAKLAATQQELAEIQTKLTTARSAHETERTLVDDLTKRRDEQQALLGRIRHELIAAESDLSGLKVERSEIEGAVLRDKEDVRALQKRMGVVAAETQTLKATLEALKKDARQQKGLVAISKKQLATAEADKDRIEREVSQAEAGVGALAASDVKREVDTDDDSPFDHFVPAGAGFAAASSASAAGVPLPASPAVTSPAGSVRSNNPFDRMGAFGGASRPISPQATGVSASTSREVPASSSASTTAGISLPVAAAAAVGTGALAAAAAVGSGFGQLFGGGGNTEDDKAQSENKDVSSPVTAPEQEDPKAELDPFGMPVAQTASAPLAESSTTTPAIATAGETAFGDDFSQGFGDDFGSAGQDQSLTMSAVPDDSAFDDAFGDVAVPPAVIVPATADTSAFTPEAVTAPVVSDQAPEMRSVTPEAVGAYPQEQEQDVFGTPGASTAVTQSPAQQIDEDSSDDEQGADEIEDAGPSSARYASRGTAAVVDDEPEQQGRSAVATGTTRSTSDSGESYVHVSESSAYEETSPPTLAPAAAVVAPSSQIQQPEEQAGFDGALPTTATSSAPPSVTSEADTFSDAQTGEPTETLPEVSSSLASQPDTGVPALAPLSIPESEPEISNPIPVFAAPPPIETPASASTPTTTTHRRAPPPPPSARSSVTSPAPIVAPVGAFDDSFGSSFDPTTSTNVEAGTAPTTSTTTTGSSGLDDFDSAFSDMGPTHASAPSGHGPSGPIGSDEFDSFDDPDFSFQPAQVPGATGASGAGALNVDNDADDDAFAEFDSSFAPPQNGTPADAPAVGAQNSEAVKQVLAMGFSRDQAVRALEKSNFDVQKAINSLLG